jgi:hypothetical protein
MGFQIRLPGWRCAPEGSPQPPPPTLATLLITSTKRFCHSPADGRESFCCRQEHHRNRACVWECHVECAGDLCVTKHSFRPCLRQKATKVMTQVNDQSLRPKATKFRTQVYDQSYTTQLHDQKPARAVPREEAVQKWLYVCELESCRARSGRGVASMFQTVASAVQIYNAIRWGTMLPEPDLCVPILIGLRGAIFFLQLMRMLYWVRSG